MKKEQAFRQDNLKSYLIGLVVFIITLALGIFIFFFCVQETIEKRAEASVMDVLSQQKAHFHSVLDVQTEIWEAVAKDMSYSDDIFAQENLRMLTSLSSSDQVDRSAIVSPKGRAVFDTGEEADLSGESHIKEALSGKTAIKAPVVSSIDGATRIVFSIPIQKAGDIVGVFCVSYDLDELNELIVKEAYDGNGYFLFVTDEDDMIAFNHQEQQDKIQTDKDFFDFCKDKNFVTGSMAIMQKDFRERKSNVLVLSDDTYSETRYLAYEPLEDSNWMVCYSVPTSQVQSQYGFIKSYESRFIFGYIVAVLLLLIWMLLVNDRHQRKLLRFASMDALTGVFNKVGTEDEITYWMNHHARAGVQAFLMLDIDKFKEINDEFGHSVGDEVLRQVGTTLQAHFRGGDIIGRIGGDEFVIMMTNIGSKDVAITRAKQLIEVFKEIEIPEMKGQALTCSMGIAFAPQHGQSYMELYKCADIALYETKRNGRDGLNVYC